MTLPTERIGDKGQRYEVTAKKPDGSVFTVGWTNDPTGGGLVTGTNLHPAWHSPEVIDRQEGQP